jgi:hypothetical protein
MDRTALHGRAGRALARILQAAAVAALCVSTARAQPNLVIKDRTDKAVRGILLRPNLAGQKFTVFVHNPGDEKVEISVALRNRSTGQEERSTALTVDPGKTSGPVVFGGVAKEAPATPTAAAAPGQSKAPPPRTELKAEPFTYDLVLLDKKGNPIPDSSRVVTLLRPDEYVDQPVVTFDGLKRELRATVKASRTFEGPEATVSLVLSPDRIPGLIVTPNKAGTYVRRLTGPGDTVELVARNLRFDEKARGEQDSGLVSLTIDGYERAFTYRVTFRLDNANNQAELIKDPVVGLSWPRYQEPAPKCTVRLRIDPGNAPRNTEVEVGLKHDDETPDYARDDLVVLPTIKDQHVWVTTAAEGSLSFETSVHDWTVEMDSAGLFNRHPLRVRLLTAGKKPFGFLDAAELLKRRDKSADVLQVTEDVEVPVTFDGSPPEIAKLGVLLPPPPNVKPVPGAKVPALREVTEATDPVLNVVVPGKRLTAFVQADDPESKIREVLFFVGKPIEGPVLKIPDTVRPVEGTKDPTLPNVWRADLSGLTDKPGVVVLSAQVTNGAGLKSFGTVEIRLLAPVPAAAGPVTPPLPSIAGRVIDDGGRLQPNLEVVLLDAQTNARRDSVRTAADGTYLFKPVAPGSYKVTARKNAANTYGETPVEVLAGEQKMGVEVKLKLR